MKVSLMWYSAPDTDLRKAGFFLKDGFVSFIELHPGGSGRAEAQPRLFSQEGIDLRSRSEDSEHYDPPNRSVCTHERPEIRAPFIYRQQ